MIPTTFGIALVIFGLYHVAPGDPALVAVGNQTEANASGGGDSESRVDKFRRENGLDRSFLVQFFDYIGPYNLSPDGHPFFSSPRTERKVEENDVPVAAGESPRTIEEGRPVAIEPLYITSTEEREQLDEWVGLLQVSGVSDQNRAKAAAELVSFANGSTEDKEKALTHLFNGLFAEKLAGPNQVPAIDRIDAVLTQIVGEQPELAPELSERDGKRHLVRRWFAWYFTEGGATRVQNSGEKKWDGLLAGDLGRELESKRPVIEELALRLKVTVPLALVAVFLTYLIALPLGIFSVRRQGTLADGALTLGLFVLYSVPTFWAGLMLILIFGKTGFDLLPVVGLYDKDFDTLSTMGKVWDVIKHSILPIVTLTYGGLAYLSRQMRAGMLDVIRQDYIRTAKAKGLSDDRVVYKHALRNSMIPVLTLLASILPILVGGALITEVIFNIQGMGKYAFEGLLKRDFSIVMATTLFVGIMTQFGILLSDIAYSLVDPRIRLH